MKPDDSERVYDGALIDVTLERWGDTEREVVEHPGSVAVLAIDSERRVALVRQRREPARAVLLELPAGTLEPGESPLVTAQRELAEETGLTGGTWHEAAAFYTTPGFCRERMHLFVAVGVRPGEASPQDDEELEQVSVALDRLDELVDEIEDGKTLAAILLVLAGRVSLPGPA